MSCDWVFVTEVKFCKEPSSMNQQLDKVHAGTTAETQISDRGQRVTEGGSPWYVTDLGKVSGFRERLQVRLLCVGSTVLMESHEGTLISDTLGVRCVAF